MTIMLAIRKTTCQVLLILAFFLNISAINAQTDKKKGYTIKGEVTETTDNNTLPYATINVADQNNKIIKRLATDVNGKFSIALTLPGKYTLTISSVGYSTGNKEFTLKEDNNLIDLGEIKLKEGVMLSEVAVEAQRPLVKSEVDKITYDMEADPESQTNNTLDMLRKVPLITIDSEDNITVNGQSNFKVLMNGKSSTLLSGNLKDVLKGIPANTIKNIEVITNPSSKYDAEGIGGIINIITTKRINGLSGSVSLNGDIWGGFGGNAYIATSIEKFSFSGRYYGGRNTQPSTKGSSNRENFFSDDYHYNQSNSNNKWHNDNHSLTLEASYEIDTLNLITLSAWGYLGNSYSSSNSRTIDMDKNHNLTREFMNEVDSKNGYGSVSGNLDYQRSFKKKDKTLTASYKFDYNPNNSSYTTHITGLLDYDSYILESANDAYGTEQTIQIDYYDPLTAKHQIEGGAKYILRQNISNSEISRFQQNEWTETENPNNLDYTQHILGLYGGYVLKLKKFTTKVGFRVESTWNDGVFKSKEITKFDNNLLNIIPYLNFAYDLGEGQTMKLGYTQRLSRPGIWYLNPYINDSDPMNISTGNPNLKSEISHSLSMGYSRFSQVFNFSSNLSATFLNNGIENITSIDNNGIAWTMPQNAAKKQDYNLGIWGSANFSPKINLYINAGVGYTNVESAAGSNLGMKNSGFNYYGSLGFRWVLWENGSINVNGGVYSPSVTLQGKYPLFYYTGLGVTQDFLKKKLSVSLSVRDPFWYKKSWTIPYNTPTYRSESTIQRQGQTVRLSISYRFGSTNTSIKKTKRSINNDDVKSNNNQSENAQ